MNAHPVNIADFRCRTIKFRANYGFLRTVPVQSGLAIVNSRRREEATADRPRVYDIGVAREAQRSRRRVLIRATSVQRRAKVLRFHEAQERVAVQVTPRWTPVAEGPYDLPPAA